MTKFAVKNKSTVVLRRYASAIAGLRSAAPFIGRQVAESAAVGLRHMTLSEEAKDQIIDMMNHEPDQKLRAREMPTVDAAHLLRSATKN